MTRTVSLVRAASLFVIVFASGPAQAGDAQPGAAEPDAASNREQIEKLFAKHLSGSVLVGSFTVDGQPADTPPKSERYEIESVVKSNADLWVFTARITYGEHDLKVPLIVPVKWAGNTPVLTLDDLTIPALGTFSARVMFHNDRYVGTWQHGKVGGHMFGRIESGSRRKAKAQRKP